METKPITPFSVPPDYFDNLTQRVMQRIDAEQNEVAQHRTVRLLLWERARTPLAVAAGFALLVALSVFAFMRSEQDNTSPISEYASRISAADFEEYIMQEIEEEEEEISDNEAIDYLIAYADVLQLQ